MVDITRAALKLLPVARHASSAFELEFRGGRLACIERASTAPSPRGGGSRTRARCLHSIVRRDRRARHGGSCCMAERRELVHSCRAVGPRISPNHTLHPPLLCFTDCSTALRRAGAAANARYASAATTGDRKRPSTARARPRARREHRPSVESSLLPPALDATSSEDERQRRRERRERHGCHPWPRSRAGQLEARAGARPAPHTGELTRKGTLSVESD
jgi:hypothetical protein